MTTLTWETASDWDGGQSDDGTVHESVANTDHDDATIVKQGYSYTNPPEAASCELLVPLDEDSGSTVYDVSGNDRDGSITGTTINQSGDLGTTAHDFDGADDTDTFPYGNALSGLSEITVAAVINPDALSTGEYQRIFAHDADGNCWQLLTDDSTDAIGFRASSGGWVGDVSFASLSTNTWQFVGGVYDGSAVYGYRDGDEFNLGSMSGSLDSLSSDVELGSQGGSQRHFDGQIAFAGVWSTALTTSQMQSLYDVINTAGTHTTSVKTS